MSVLLNIYLNHGKNDTDLWEGMQAVNTHAGLAKVMRVLLQYINLYRYGREIPYRPWKIAPDHFDDFVVALREHGECALENELLDLTVGQKGVIIRGMVLWTLQYFSKEIELQQLVREVVRPIGHIFGASDALYFADSGDLSLIADLVLEGRDLDYVLHWLDQNGARKASVPAEILRENDGWLICDGYFHEKIPRAVK